MHSRRYSSFISYRHADNTQEGRRWAEWLHRGLERYTVPPDLIGTPNLRGENCFSKESSFCAFHSAFSTP